MKPDSKTPTRLAGQVGAKGEAGNLEEDGTAHGATAVERASLMLDFAKAPTHRAYFARLAIKLLKPIAGGA